MLVLSGIYDILTESKLNAVLIKQLLDNPRNKESVDYLLRNIRSASTDNTEDIEVEAIEETEEYDIEKYGYKMYILFHLSNLELVSHLLLRTLQRQLQSTERKRWKTTKSWID